ncbi:MAG: DNA mismatch repair endonuclease MutL, partial [Candidatus Dormibacteraeota bacterium]|nr:DNA mismatch repair endonuclease MutL [Candidatus Dormibacteraeota bacterium]
MNEQKIAVLPPPVADAIAAGEVIERPAAVVKELVENALDAGARHIQVDVRGAGRTLIRVADDGAGIPPGELALAFQRHATSKVHDLDDLRAIATLGFRGEALASIAAVADVECRSQAARVRLRGGALVEEGVAMPTPGTLIEVRDLFGTTPARLRFLKSEATEQSLCLRAVQPYAVLYPEVRFTVTLEGRTALRTLGSGERRQAMAAVYGEEAAGALLEVAGDGISGLVSEPRLSRGTRDALLLAVNRRPIASRSLAYAVEECYLGSLERGRHPVCILDLELPADAVDVNVHPTKREVRFHDERELFGRLQRSVREVLTETRPYEVRLPSGPEPEDGGGLQPSLAMRAPTVHGAAVTFPTPLPEPPDAGSGVLRALGQVDDAYLICEGRDGVVLVDQHAAHERVLYNGILSDLARGTRVSQPLLLAQVVDLEPSLVATAEDRGDRLRALGFEVEAFGPGQLRLLAGPAATPPGRLAEALTDLLAVLAEQGHDGSWEAAAASLACHSAVRFGDRLDLAEQ